jgi:hypothetical protein
VSARPGSTHTCLGQDVLLYVRAMHTVHCVLCGTEGAPSQAPMYLDDHRQVRG